MGPKQGDNYDNYCCACACACACACVCVHVHACVCVCVLTCVRAYMSLPVQKCVSIYAYVQARVY